jgi:hypothetical protein
MPTKLTKLEAKEVFGDLGELGKRFQLARVNIDILRSKYAQSSSDFAGRWAFVSAKRVALVQDATSLLSRFAKEAASDELAHYFPAPEQYIMIS